MSDVERLTFDEFSKLKPLVRAQMALDNDPRLPARGPIAEIEALRAEVVALQAERDDWKAEAELWERRWSNTREQMDRIQAERDEAISLLRALFAALPDELHHVDAAGAFLARYQDNA